MSDDLVSRQIAKDAICNACGKIDCDQMDTCEKLKLPSAQPIRCKDCRHRDPEDHKCDCGHDIIWQLPRDDKWYCADAERRIDEND